MTMPRMRIWLTFSISTASLNKSTGVWPHSTTRTQPSSSGPTARAWNHGATAGHHLIDPRTGRPGESGWTLVSVIGDSCLVADAVAKAAWLLDGDAPDWIEDHGIAARLVHRDGYEVVVGEIERWVTGGVRRWR